MQPCFRCHSQNVVKGNLSDLTSGATSRRLIFKPDNLKFTAMTLSGGVPVDAYSCLECGLVWVETDSAALNAFVEKNCNKK